jgi:hypothetical protein
MTIYTDHRHGQNAEWSCLLYYLDEVDLTGKERAETENKLRESERSLILFENNSYQSLRATFKTTLHNLEGNGPTSKL